MYITFRAAREQQAAELDLLRGRLATGLAATCGADRLTGPGPVLVGVGASMAATTAAVWSMRSRGIEAYRLSAGDHPVPFPQTNRTVIGVSQSGRSPETLEALAMVPPAHRLVVVNSDPSPLAAAADGAVVSLGAIPDSYASTVGFTGTVMALGMIADLWEGGEVDPGWAAVPAAVEAVEAAVARSTDRLVDAFSGAAWADLAGVGPSVGSAEMGALLLREVARVPATGMGTRQYLHGAMESAGGGVHVLFGAEREAAVAATLADAGHQAILVTDLEVTPTARVAVVRLPARPAAQRALLEAVVMQALAAAVAAARGIDVEDFVFHHADTKVAGGGTRL